MASNSFFARATAITAVYLSAFALNATAEEPAQLDVVFWDAERIAAVKTELRENDDAFRSEIKRLKKAAKKARGRGPYSVMDKDESPPGGDKHDYLSFSRYWWPDPDKKDGLPYIRHDGKVNRKLVNRGDRDRIGDLMDDIVPLALASYLLDDKKAGEHGAKLLRVWFLDESTRMKPHLKYAQGVPGRSKGRGVGIIDTRGFIWLLDSVALLRASGALTDEDERGLQAWFADFLKWLETSRLARSEKTAENNHGSWYAAQVCRIAMFANKPDVVRAMANDVKSRRIPDQIADDGSQPYELERTLSQHYSFFNLAALTVVARVGEQVDIDVWDSQLKRAAGYMAQFAGTDKKWPHPQIKKKAELSLAEKAAFMLMADRYDDAALRRLIAETPAKDGDSDFTRLLFPSSE